MPLPYYISLFVHILCAAFWIGGMLFLPTVLLPSIKYETNRRKLLYATGVRFRLYGWFALGLLLVSGLTNMLYRGFPFSWSFLFSNEIGRYLGVKMIAFVLILLISAVHDFYLGKKVVQEEEGEERAFQRSVARWSGRIDLLLALLAAFLGLLVSRGGF